jgi:hypothetical protein
MKNESSTGLRKCYEIVPNSGEDCSEKHANGAQWIFWAEEPVDVPVKK